MLQTHYLECNQMSEPNEIGYEHDHNNRVHHVQSFIFTNKMFIHEKRAIQNLVEIVQIAASFPNRQLDCVRSWILAVTSVSYLFTARHRILWSISSLWVLIFCTLSTFHFSAFLALLAAGRPTVHPGQSGHPSF